MLRKIRLSSTKGHELIDITDALHEELKATGIQEGMCTIVVPHTTAGLTITSYHDPAGFEDIIDEINRLVPTRIDFKHQYDTPSDAAGHVKSVIVGPSLTLIVSEGRLLLGHSQKVYFFEFDGPRERSVQVKFVAG